MKSSATQYLIPTETEISLEACAICARAGDEQALAALVLRTRDRLFRLFVFLTRNPALAEDLCQDTYIRVMEKLHHFQGGSFQSWLATVARNLFLDYVRIKKNQSQLDGGDDAFLQLFEHQDRDLVYHVQTTLSRLSAEDRLVLVLIDIQGHSYTETSRIIGISEAALNSRLHRARKEFTRIYEKK